MFVRGAWFQFRPAVAQAVQMNTRMQSGLAPLPVVTGYLDVEKPTILDAAYKLYEGGTRRLLVTPVLLSAGRHACEDLPDSLAQFRKLCPACEVEITVSLSESTYLTPILRDLIGRNPERNSEAGAAMTLEPLES